MKFRVQGSRFRVYLWVGVASLGFRAQVPQPPEQPGQPEPAMPPAANQDPGTRHRGPTIHHTPAILGQLAPPGAGLLLDVNGHRFCATFATTKSVATLLGGTLSQTHFTRTFKNRSWEAILSSVHAWLWEKYETIPAGSRDPLPAGTNLQSIGVVPQSVILELRPIIEALPPAKHYSSSSKAT